MNPSNIKIILEYSNLINVYFPLKDACVVLKYVKVKSKYKKKDRTNKSRKT